MILSQSRLTAYTVAGGAGTLQLATPLTDAALLADLWVVVDAFTSDCQLARVASRSADGSNVTLERSLPNAPSVGALVLALSSLTPVRPEWFGARSLEMPEPPGFDIIALGETNRVAFQRAVDSFVGEDLLAPSPSALLNGGAVAISPGVWPIATTSGARGGSGINIFASNLTLDFAGKLLLVDPAPDESSAVAAPPRWLLAVFGRHVTLNNPRLDGNRERVRFNGTMGTQAVLHVREDPSADPPKHGLHLTINGGTIENGVGNLVLMAARGARILGTRFRNAGEHGLYLAANDDADWRPVDNRDNTSVLLQNVEVEHAGLLVRDRLRMFFEAGGSPLPDGSEPFLGFLNGGPAGAPPFEGQPLIAPLRTELEHLIPAPWLAEVVQQGRPAFLLPRRGQTIACIKARNLSGLTIHGGLLDAGAGGWWNRHGVILDRCQAVTIDNLQMRNVVVGVAASRSTDVVVSACRVEAISPAPSDYPVVPADDEAALLFAIAINGGRLCLSDSSSDRIAFNDCALLTDAAGVREQAQTYTRCTLRAGPFVQSAPVAFETALADAVGQAPRRSTQQAVHITQDSKFVDCRFVLGAVRPRRSHEDVLIQVADLVGASLGPRSTSWSRGVLGFRLVGCSFEVGSSWDVHANTLAVRGLLARDYRVTDCRFREVSPTNRALLVQNSPGGAVTHNYFASFHVVDQTPYFSDNFQ